MVTNNNATTLRKWMTVIKTTNVFGANHHQSYLWAEKETLPVMLKTISNKFQQPLLIATECMKKSTFT
jgi:hypothetical protein